MNLCVFHRNVGAKVQLFRVMAKKKEGKFPTCAIAR